jgi:hypothetical protein
VPIGGTSAVAPLYAGLFAAFGTKLGFITPQLWLNHLCFNDIKDGDNGKFRARSGPDPCTGIGSPIGTKLGQLLVHLAVNTVRQLKDLQFENEKLRQDLRIALSSANNLPIASIGGAERHLSELVTVGADGTSYIVCAYNPTTGQYDLNCREVPMSSLGFTRGFA